MFDGKERRLELIRELQTTHALQEEGQKEKAKERGRVQSLQQESLRSEHREEMVGDLTEEPVAREVGQQLDFLNKELRRLQVRGRRASLFTPYTLHLPQTHHLPFPTSPPFPSSSHFPLPQHSSPPQHSPPLPHSLHSPPPPHSPPLV